MNPREETLATWNKVASLYQDKFMDLDFYNESYDAICNLIPQENAKLLEIGCGPGNITKYLLSKRPDFSILGIDFSSNMIDLAQQNNPTARFKVMDSRDINQLQTKFDGIICGFCIPYLSAAECKKLISDCSYLLNDNGLLYVSFVEGDAEKSGFQTGSSGDRTYFYYHNLGKLKNQLESNRFDSIGEFHVNYPRPSSETEIHTLLISRKKK